MPDQQALLNGPSCVHAGPMRARAGLPVANVAAAGCGQPTEAAEAQAEESVTLEEAQLRFFVPRPMYTAFRAAAWAAIKHALGPEAHAVV